MKNLGRFSIGVGDRFGREGIAQISAAAALKKEAGVAVDLVWNKSNREHKIIGTVPADQRRAADNAIARSGWKGSYFVDADHIGLTTVAGFLPHCDFFTIDVADFIGQAADAAAITAFEGRHRDLIGAIAVPGIPEALRIDSALLRATAAKYLTAVAEAGKVYRSIRDAKGADGFVAEVSMDETAQPQVPAELLVILAALADEGVALRTIAPKFSGRFNKGVEYSGDPLAFEKEFRDDVAVVAYAVAHFGLPGDLKLSVHSGSDKFAIYPGISRVLRETGAGLHLKTAGTTWLEELVGLAESGGEGLAIAREIYRVARSRYDELVGPYESVVEIAVERLPKPDEVGRWSGPDYAAALRHVQSEPRYNPSFRQYLHVSYKVAAELGARFTDALEANRLHVERNVRENLLERHLKPLFVGV